MLGLESRDRGSALGLATDDWRERVGLRRADQGGPSTAWLIVGAVAIGLGVMALISMGPELRRYLKIRAM
jgi:hypothetical protein